MIKANYRSSCILRNLVWAGEIKKETLAEYGLGTMVVYKSSPEGEIYQESALVVQGTAKHHVSRRGVGYTKIIMPDCGWRTIYATREDAELAERLRASDREERRLKQWLKRRSIFNR